MLDLFKVGFLTVTLLDIIDIILVTLIIYKIYTIIRGTIASQIFIGLIIVLFLSFLAQAINLKAVGWLLKLVTDIWVIAFIILFQPEIRRLLTLLGANPLIRLFVKSDVKNVADILAEAAFELAQHQHGALIVIIKDTGIRGVVETGEIINAKVTKNLLRSIFYPRSPLHDGAVVIKGDVIEAARCTLPLSQTTSVDGIELGMRHRAGLGMTEQVDLISLIVSEETGGISIAENGILTRGLSKDSLKKRLTESLKRTKVKSWTNIFDQFLKAK
jgi:diadenylate cyclase